MLNEWYLDVGYSAVQNIAQGYLCSWAGPVKKMLDLPCGHGRVLRHLVNLFPEAEVHTCDLDRSGVDFCRDTFGAKPIYSIEELSDVQFPMEYDLIWVGSLFTHTARGVLRRWLAHLAKFLSPRGILVATMHGRWCETVAKSHNYINAEAWADILADYRATGYGYQDYARTENHDYIEGSYGVSLSTASEIVKEVERIPGLRLYSYTERAWADHQDVFVVGRPAYNEAW